MLKLTSSVVSNGARAHHFGDQPRLRLVRVGSACRKCRKAAEAALSFNPMRAIKR